MANITHADVSAFMGLEDFDANSQPTSTDVGTIIDEVEAALTDLEVSLTTNQMKLLAKLRVAALISRAAGLFDQTGISRAEGYWDEYNNMLRDIRNSRQYEDVPGAEFASGKVRKVNR